MEILERLYWLFHQDTTQDQINRYLNGFQKVDWEQLLAASRQGGAQPLLYLKLNALGEQITVPAFVLKELHEGYLASTGRNMVMLHNTAKILTACQAAGIDVTGLKGIYLVENVYQAIGARPFGDVDLMVRKAQISGAVSQLEQLGYHQSTYFSAADTNLDIKHVPPMVNEAGVTVELHWTILEEEEPFTIDVGGLWARAIPAQIGGVGVLALSPEDLLVHLCLHLGYQHSWNMGFRGLYDIAEVLRHFETTLDWTMVRQIAEDWGAERVTWMALDLAEALFGAPVPKAFMDALQPGSLEPWMIAQARSLLMSTAAPKAPMTPDLAGLAGEKGIIKRFKRLFSRVFIPRSRLARLYNVPPDSIRIYGCYFKRFFELKRQYGSSVRRLFKKDSQLQTSAEKERHKQHLKAWLGNQK